MNVPPICLPSNTKLPTNIDIGSPLIFHQYKANGQHEGNTDFLVLAEFSEIEGPVPLLVIPSNIKPFIEVNELVMNLMSTDYQCRGTNEFRIWDCASLTLLNHGLGQFICAQYFILYDIRARGFVRPMCIAYCSTSLQKILNYEANLEKEIWKAIDYLKTCNLKTFKQELRGRVKDLLYTKKRLLISEKPTKHKDGEIGPEDATSSSEQSKAGSSQNTGVSTQVVETPSDSSIGSCDSVRLSSTMFADCTDDVNDNGEESVLQHVTLDSLATQITDCQNIFRIVTDYLKASTVKAELQYLKERISKPMCALRKYFDSEEPTFVTRPYIPSVFAWSMVRRNYRNMRKIKDLCGVGYLACLLKLLNVVDTYSKSYTDLFFHDLELKHGLLQSPVQTLQMGLISCEAHFGDRLPAFSLADDFYDGRLAEILASAEKATTGSKNVIESYSSDISDGVAALVEIVESKISLQCVRNGDSAQHRPSYDCVTSRLTTNWHMLLESFGEAIKSILYSVLCGRTLVVAGPETMEEKVSAVIDTLSSILPFRKGNNFPVLRWHMGIVTRYHLSCYRIIGVCIPERLHLHELMSNDTLNKVTVLNVSTDRISGMAYCGKYLQTANYSSSRRRKAVSAKSGVDACFQTVIQNILIRIGRDGFLLTQMLSATNRSDDQILKGLGIHPGDWTAVKYISSLIRNAI